MSLLRADLSELAEQDAIILTDTNPSLKSALREQLRPRGFMLVLIGKDGGVKLRKPFPWNVREISRVIDKMPMRRQEINDGG
jgi:protein-L-isoaspartate O-methyltransferase